MKPGPDYAARMPLHYTIVLNRYYQDRSTVEEMLQWQMCCTPIIQSNMSNLGGLGSSEVKAIKGHQSYGHQALLTGGGRLENSSNSYYDRIL